MPRRKKQLVPLVSFMVSKVGYRQAVKVGSFLAQWGTVARSMPGKEPTYADYCRYWQCSTATYYRDLARLQAVWPEDRTPQRVWAWIEDQVSAGSVDESAVEVLMATIRA